MSNLSADALKAAIGSGTYSGRDSEFLTNLLNQKTQAVAGADLRNDLPT